MRVFKWLAVLALVQATCAAHEDNEESKLARMEKLAEMGNHMSRHLRKRVVDHAHKGSPNSMRHAQEHEHRLEEEAPSSKRAARADEIRRVSGGLKELARQRMDPRTEHNLDAVKMSHHSKAALDRKRSAEQHREHSADGEHAAKEERMRTAAKQLSHKKLDQAGAGLKKFAKATPPVNNAMRHDQAAALDPKKAIPPVKKAVQQDQAAAPTPKKMKGNPLKDAQNKLAQSAQRKFKDAQDESSDPAEDGEE